MAKSRHSGISFSTQKPRKSAVPPTRTKNRGWTPSVSARNRKFLISVNACQLSGIGSAITLTCGDYVPTPAEWKRARKNLFQWIRDNYDVTRIHDICEMQKRGVPHLHFSIWGGVSGSAQVRSAALGLPLAHGDYHHEYGQWWKTVPCPEAIVRKWLHLTRSWGTRRLGQHWASIDDKPVFWLEYTAKHGARGVANYQRDIANMPDSWQGNTPQLWSKCGDWPIPPALEVCGVDEKDLYQFRRILLRHMSELPSFMRVKAENRATVSAFFRDYLRPDRNAPDDKKSTRFKGLSVFVPQPVQLRIFKGINPGAYFMDEDTGEIYEDPSEIDFATAPEWVAPPPPITDMSDLFGPSA